MVPEPASPVVETGRFLHWTAWVPLLGASRNRTLPRTAGLYRIRRISQTDLDYIGQTGLVLPQRLGMLGGVFHPQMPYADPHTAAPALWALRQATDCEFEVSVAPVVGETAWRKGLESLAIADYRWSHGASPTVQFGRMPDGYRKSSGNNAQLVARGMRVRGGPTDVLDASHDAGLGPDAGLLDAAFREDADRAPWSPWWLLSPVTLAGVPTGNGLYLIAAQESGALLYVGQGSIQARLRAHLAKLIDRGHTQGQLFAVNAPLLVSWIVDETLRSHHRLELENDLIAAWLVRTGQVPAAQFRG